MEDQSRRSLPWSRQNAGGTITFIGLVTGIDPPDSMGETLKRVFTVRGIHVGSRVMMEEMMDAMEANKIQPVIDKTVFRLEELKEALQYLVSLMSFSLPFIPGTAR